MTDEHTTQPTDIVDRAREIERNAGTNVIVDRLRSLQSPATAPYDWHEFKRRSQESRGSQWHRTAIAASFVLVLAGIAGWMRYSAGDGLALDPPVGGVAMGGGIPHTGGQPMIAHDPANPDAGVAYWESINGDSNVVVWDSYETQRATSQWLANLPMEPAIVRVASRLPVLDLEDHIAWIDDMLNTAQIESAQPAHIQALQRERAQLISSLARVRYAETLAAER